MSDDETKSEMFSRILIGTVMAGLISMLGYVGIGYRDLSTLVAKISAQQEEASKHFEDLIELTSINSKRMDAFDAYIVTHAEYGKGVINLANQKIEFVELKTDSQYKSLKEAIESRSADRYTGTQGRAHEALSNERHRVYNRRFAEIEADCREHKKDHNNGS